MKYKFLLCTSISLGISTASNTAIASDMNTEGHYIIPESGVLQITPLDRNYYDKFDLDDITITIENNHEFSIKNNSPRILYRPIISVNDIVYMIDTDLPVYSSAIISHTFSGDINTISYINQKPFFKTEIREYAQTTSTASDGREIFGVVDENMATLYNRAIRGWKYIENRLDTNLAFLHWQDASYPWDDATRVDNYFSRLDFQHSSTYYRLQNTAAVGTATIGNGKIGMYPDRLKEEPGTTAPYTTYYHEKLHNHGYTHDSGMTYGWSDYLANYIKQNQTDFFSHAETLDQTNLFAKSILDTQYSHKDILHLRWGTKDSHTPVLKSLIVAADNTLLQSVSVEKNSSVINTPLPSENFINKIFVYDTENIEIPVQHISTINDKRDGISVTLDKPTYPTNIYVNVAANNTGELSGSYVFSYPDNIGYKNSDYNATLFLEKTVDHKYKKFSANEAQSYCLTKGLTLAKLPETNSVLLKLNTDYRSSGSIIGLDPQTEEPTAYSILSNSTILKPTNSGALVVCSIANI